MAADGAASMTESCSIADTTTAGRPHPRSARALASVPPPVKTTPAGGAPASVATASRASSSRRRAARPKAWTEDGLPTVESAFATASAASGRTGVVAL